MLAWVPVGTLQEGMGVYQFSLCTSASITLERRRSASGLTAKDGMIFFFLAKNNQLLSRKLVLDTITKLAH